MWRYVICPILKAVKTHTLIISFVYTIEKSKVNVIQAKHSRFSKTQRTAQLSLMSRREDQEGACVNFNEPFFGCI